MKYNEREALTKELKYAKAEAERFRGEHQEACHLVAQMHAAAVGEVTGPNRGVVEDVEDLRLRAEDGKRDYDALMRKREQVGNALGERTQERDDARLSCDQWKKEWELSERNKMDREAELAVIREEKNVAYSERDRLVAALSALYPSHLQRHPEGDVEWEDDWRWIVVVQLATGQATWHIHDSELNWFDHLDRNQVTEWDGHTTDEKYLRLDTIRMAGRQPPESGM